MLNKGYLGTWTAGLLVSAAVGMFAACSSDPAGGGVTPTNPADSGLPNDSGSSTDKDSGKGPDAGPSPEGGMPSAKTGFVTLIYYDTATAHSLFGSAGFSDQASANAPTCTKTTEGACVVEDCVKPAAVDAGPTPVEPTAGVIAITGGTIPAGLKLTPNAAGVYSPSSIPMSQAWLGATDITFTAAGAGVPAFTKMLKSPATLTLTSPHVTTWDSSTSRDITWSGTGLNSVVLTLSKSSTTNLVLATCTFAASALTGSVPAAALVKLKGSVFYEVAHEDSSAITPGGYDVKVLIRSFLREAASTNGLATGSITVN